FPPLQYFDAVQLQPGAGPRSRREFAALSLPAGETVPQRFSVQSPARPVAASLLPQAAASPAPGSAALLRHDDEFLRVADVLLPHSVASQPRVLAVLLL